MPTVFRGSGPLASVAITCVALGLSAGAAQSPDAGRPVHDPPEPQPQSSPPPEDALPPVPGPKAPGVPSASPLEEPEAVVYLKDGQRVTGLLVAQDSAQTVLRVEGRRLTIRGELVERVQVLPSVLERYRELRGAIDDGDTEQLLLLARWLRSRGALDLALTELDHILAVDPHEADAIRLREMVVLERDLALKAPARGGGSGAPAAPQDAGASERAEPPRLTADQINLIRVYEVDLANPARMTIARDTIERLLRDHAGDPLVPATDEGREAVYRQAPEQILDLMFRLRARELYGLVRVTSDPTAMRLFREDVHRTLIANSCATSRCHGGEAAGRLRLLSQRPGSDSTVYTNFLILERFRTDDHAALIDYEDPARSALLQLALPRKDSLRPHPEVPQEGGASDAWRPFFRSTNDRRFRQAVEWIQAMYRPRPEYPIEYAMPAPPDRVPEAPASGDPPHVR